VPLNEESFKSIDPDDITSLTVLKDAGATSIYGSRGANGVIIINTKSGAKEIEALQQVKARKNFDETAFFYPQILTDKEGRFSFSFTTPEALTEWKLRLLAHNKEAASGYYENTFITQKDLMIVPNMPRFLREKDTITLAAKVTNLTAEVKTGNALLQLFDATTMAPADAQMLNIQNLQPFTIPAKGNTTVQWKITIPKGMQGVQYKVLAKAGNFSDGEENILPVLTNSIMVTESIPLWVKPNATKEYSFKDFDKSFSNQNISQIGMTLEYTSNPAWLALQSLPYLMEFEHECAEQVFSRYYANSIATHVLNSNPKIAEVFAAWRKAGKPLSKFEQNEELKSIVLSETPWILENQSSEEIKNRLALLFDLDKMKTSLGAAFTKLQDKQAASGGFPWFEGGKESSYITRHIAAGFGHLAKMRISTDDQKAIDVMTKKAITFMDNDFIKEHNRRFSYLKKGTTYNYELPNDGMHYLYARSFYLEQYPISDSIKKITDGYLRSMNKSTAYLKMKWLDFSLYEKGMAALIMNRYGYKDVAKKILNNLKETSSTNEEWGMYWIENKAGWNWYQAPIETQALLIEAFTEIDNDIASVDAMKVWLLKNKQNKNWPTTRSTAEAVYALLMKGTDWLSVKDNTIFKLGNQKAIDDKLAENDKEAGTGYIKLQWKPEEMKPGMGTLTVENKSAVTGFGGFYWQRSYEEADKDYNPIQGILSVTKELYIKTNTADGVQLQTITKEKPLKIGNLVTVRLIINAKEDMEYLHLKDMRASAFEPIDIISERKYNSGTSYYQSTRDVATHFFFDSLNKGVYVIEYDVRVNNSGDFSNGIATIQSMYAPEFSGNSRSVRLHID
jgi:TonB-dependent SusC/RagA subfamily outer membrane receptor